jgi:hypothetical protein
LAAVAGLTVFQMPAQQQAVIVGCNTPYSDDEFQKLANEWTKIEIKIRILKIIN